ncbi:tetratricopeptide repeat protein [Sulfuriflexus mobilis]|uniref:tetratricopeptide repeat protein n=1 Tax=Sulfuriflexus mobilis TaxID=1811807 RepID=UPI000F81B113|nr:tetratricopeptide repeat protein [Sulfuriflexus mobilis]
MLNKNVLFVLLAYIAVGITVAYVFIRDDKVEAVAQQVAVEEMSLAEARQAFWARDMARAERLYRKITTADEGNINAWGELGNIYYLQSRWQDAAAAYTEVALRLVEMGDIPQAVYLQQLVSRLDGKQALRIHERLRSQQSSTQG